MGLATIGTILQIGSTVLGVIGSIQEGQQQKALANYRAGLARNNAIIAERAAKREEQIGQNKEAMARRRGRLALGAQRASAASRGVDVDEGSALDIGLDIQQLGKLDQLLIRDESMQRALGFRTQAGNFRSEADMRRIGGRQAQTSSFFSAGGTLLEGAGSVASKWYQGVRDDQLPNPFELA